MTNCATAGGRPRRRAAANVTFNLRLTVPPRRRKEAVTDRLDTVFAALADPTRRRILVMLLEDDMAVTDVADPFEMSLAAISKHLRC
jgi:DNA-binding transcriptional ArsR family regulator